jgi:hypothetical protein
MTEDLYAKAQKAFEEAEQKRGEANRKFDIKALAASTRTPQTIKDRKLGNITYYLLTDAEVSALNLTEIKDPAELVDTVVFAMLKKADPTLERSDYDALHFPTKRRLRSLISTTFNSFL